MPETASWSRRILAIVIDYAACLGIMLLIYGEDWFGSGPWPSVYYQLLFVAEASFFTALLGGSFGQLATRLRVVRVDGRRLSFGRALLRSALIPLVIPPVVARPDGRGLHDMVVDSMVVPLVPAP